jgi:hypothetical protein
MTQRISVVVLIISLLISACTSPPDQTPKSLPAPERLCPVTLNWHGIQPGKSNQQDVIKNLGQPARTGRIKIDDSQEVSFFAYSIKGGRVSEFAQDRVFFRPDGIVDWVDEMVADRDGIFHSVQETVNQLGSTLDTGYVNSNYHPSVPRYDIMTGPDQIYVWSECGLALDVVNPCLVSKQDCLLTEDNNKPVQGITPTLAMRYPSPYRGREPNLNANNIVLMRFLFSPTSHEGFKEFYLLKVPYGLWPTKLQNLQR